ncbi:hypothetical protein NL676_027476 [Syzygium grande]|nr:hypothetical protein NL676_027476 [Syzygium grande]
MPWAEALAAGGTGKLGGSGDRIEWEEEFSFFRSSQVSKAGEDLVPGVICSAVFCEESRETASATATKMAAASPEIKSSTWAGPLQSHRLPAAMTGNGVSFSRRPKTRRLTS